MIEKLKQELIESLTLIDSWKGKNIEIVDRISRVKDNYDRHFTTSSKFIFKLDEFGVRTSGGIAALEGKNIYFEFRTGNIVAINKTEKMIIFDIQIKESIFRRIEIGITL